MKCQVVFLFVVVIAASVSADELNSEQVRKFYEECQADPATYVEQSALKKAIDGNIDVAAVGPHSLCMNVKIGLQKPNGDIDKKELREAIKVLPDYDESKADTIVEECGTRKGATAQEAAVALTKCYVEHSRIKRHIH